MPPDRKIMRDIGLIAVLKVLERGRMSGYEVIAALTRPAGANATPGGDGEVYAHLYLLEAKGLVRGEWETLHTGRRRRCYRLTSRGHRRLARKTAGWLGEAGSPAWIRDLLGASPAECVWKGARA